MRKNVGTLDAYIRLICGFTMLGFGTMQKSKWTIFIGSMKIAEGLVRFCPCLYMMGLATTEWELNHHNCNCHIEHEYDEYQEE